MNQTFPKIKVSQTSKHLGRCIHDWLQNVSLRVGQSSLWHFAMALVLCGLMSFSALNPQSSWDVLGYTGSALHLAGADNVHGEAYALVSAGLGEDFVPLTLDNPQGRASSYRSTMSQNPEAFAQQLPYYMIRPVYVAALAAGYQLGFNPLDIMLALSIASGFIIGTLVYLRLLKSAMPMLSFLLTTVLLLVFRLPSFAGFLSPDPLVAALFICFVFQFEKGLSVISVLGFVMALILLRSNAVVFTTPLLAVGLLAHYIQAPMTRLNISQVLGIFSVSILLMKLIEFWAGNYGWWTVFHFTFIESTNFPANFTGSFEFGLYFDAVMRGARWLLSDRYVTCFYLFMGLMLCHFVVGDWYEKKVNTLLFFLMLCVIFSGYFLLFPAVFLRFHFSVFLLSGVYAFVCFFEHTSRFVDKRTSVSAASRYQ